MGACVGGFICASFLLVSYILPQMLTHSSGSHSLQSSCSKLYWSYLCHALFVTVSLALFLMGVHHLITYYTKLQTRYAQVYKHNILKIQMQVAS